MFSCIFSQRHLNQEYLESMLVLRKSCTDMYLFTTVSVVVCVWSLQVNAARVAPVRGQGDGCEEKGEGGGETSFQFPDQAVLGEL